MQRRLGLAMESLWSKEKEAASEEESGSVLGLKVLLVGVVAWLISRAFFLQVVTGQQNWLLAEGNRVEIRHLLVERGIIKDRFGRVVARNTLNEDGELVREYPIGLSGAHLLGYIGEVSPAEMAECWNCFDLGEKVGKLGIEKLLGQRLRGVKAEELVEMSANNEVVRVISHKEGTAGETVQLSIDGELQQTISRILAEYEESKGRPVSGAVVVSKVGSGELLAMVSWPSFDPNLFSAEKWTGGKYTSVDQVLGDSENKPMFNRAIGGAFAPGSVFKLVTAVAGLEEGKIDGGTRVLDSGEIKVGEYRYGNWYFDQYGRTEGEVDVKRALARSNDIFFYKVGEWLGVENLSQWSRRLGLGQVSALAWPGEAGGLVPDPLERERRSGERWFLGNTYHYAIGQGDLMTSPMQINRMTAAVVSGRLCEWRIVAGEEPVCEDLGLSQATRELVLSGMKEACASGGTAFPFFEFSPAVACKTGTAQHGGEKTPPHAWITVIVPKVEGERLIYEEGVVISVLLPEAGEGSYEAGPVAERIARFVREKEY